jgi:hypothetical protein
VSASRFPGAGVGAVAVLVVLATAGCASHGSQASQLSGVKVPVSSPSSAADPSQGQTSQGAEAETAALACSTALGGGVVSAVATTVAAVRAWGIGPTPANDLPAAHAFPGESGDAFAAWCWVGSNGEYASWGVDEHGAKIEFGTVTGDASAPSGPIGIGS